MQMKRQKRNYQDCLNVFIFADNESKIERAEKYFNITREEAPAVLKKKDKARANHYKYYTEKDWKEPSNYDICINSDAIGIDNAVNLICDMVKNLIK